jgi:Cu2+-exporting ATPase
MMSGPAAERDFLRRFFAVTFLLLPLIILTPTALTFLGHSDFALRKYLQFAVATVIFYLARVFFEHARHEVKARQYGMMTLVSVAVAAGYLFSAASTFFPQLDVEFYLEISSLIWVLLFGHYLEARSSSAAGDALSEVAKLLPKKAHLLKDGQIREVELSELKKGDLVRVLPGEKIPADGVIIDGEANVDEALISGESKPIKKSVEAAVVAGAICLDGSLTVRLTRVGESSTIGQIKSLILEAQKTKPAAQKLADRAARVLTFTALGTGLLTILFWTLIIGQPLVFGLTLAITVLVIACPHALGLAIPTVSTIATTLATRNGVFLKDLGKLEVIKAVDYVIFDKTGTLTKGEFGVTDIVQSSKFKVQNYSSKLKIAEGERKVLRIAASLEQHSSHVIGQAIVRFAKDKGINTRRVSGFKNLAGQGVSGVIDGTEYYLGNLGLVGEKYKLPTIASDLYHRLSSDGKTVVFLADDGGLLGVLALADQIKPESFEAVKKLHRLGVKVAMLTGDNEEAAKNVSRELGIDRYFAEVKPEEKYRHVKSLQEAGHKVLMAGDGVNDAPALTQADVGVAIGAGTDVAVESGDAVLTRNNPEDIVRLIKLSKKVYRKMLENLFWALGYNVLAIPAAAGLFAPWGFFLRPEIGALLMAGSSVIVVANALTLKRLQLS